MFMVTGRYMDGNKVVYYRVQDINGNVAPLTKEQVVKLCFEQNIINCKAIKSRCTYILSGVHCNLNDLPTLKCNDIQNSIIEATGDVVKDKGLFSDKLELINFLMLGDDLQIKFNNKKVEKTGLKIGYEIKNVSPCVLIDTYNNIKIEKGEILILNIDDAVSFMEKNTINGHLFNARLSRINGKKYCLQQLLGLDINYKKIADIKKVSRLLSTIEINKEYEKEFSFLKKGIIKDGSRDNEKYKKQAEEHDKKLKLNEAYSRMAYMSNLEAFEFAYSNKLWSDVNNIIENLSSEGCYKAIKYAYDYAKQNENFLNEFRKYSIKMMKKMNALDLCKLLTEIEMNEKEKRDIIHSLKESLNDENFNEFMKYFMSKAKE